MHRRRLLALPLLAAVVLVGYLPLPAADQPAQPTVRAASTGGRSPHETFSAVIGDRRTGPRITITYGRPYSKDPRSGEVRKIWGTLVPWERAYRLGADEATLLITQKPLVFGSTTIPAGAHTLYMVPSESGASKLAFSTNLGKWGVPVDESSDLARVDLKKDALPNTVDQLTLAIESNQAGNGGTLKIMWENTQFSAEFTVQQ